MYHKENEAIDKLMVERRRIEARSAADTQMVSELLSNQTVELLQDQQYIYDYEDSQAKVQTPFTQISSVHILTERLTFCFIPVHLMNWILNAAHNQRVCLRTGHLGQGGEKVGRGGKD
jgi:hypothetical protein